MSNIEFDEECPVCGVKLSTPTTQFRLNTGAIVGKDFVYSRICKYLSTEKVPSCINKQGEYVESEGWLGWQE